MTISVRVDRPAFDATRAFQDLQAQVAFGPRVPGMEGHARQFAWMVEQLSELADTVFLDEFEHVTGDGDSLSLTNVIARFGLESDRRLLLLTHWDTRPTADQSRDDDDREKPVPGANDGASGTAVLLELARMFAEQAPPGGVDLLFSDGEDYGPTTADMFLGAAHYATGRGSEAPPDFAVLLDMVGDADPRFPVEAYSLEAAPQLVQRVWGIAADLGYRRYFPLDETARGRPSEAQRRRNPHHQRHRLRLRVEEQPLAHALRHPGEHERADVAHSGGRGGRVRLP